MEIYEGAVSSKRKISRIYRIRADSGAIIIYSGGHAVLGTDGRGTGCDGCDCGGKVCWTLKYIVVYNGDGDVNGGGTRSSRHGLCDRGGAVS